MQMLQILCFIVQCTICKDIIESIKIYQPVYCKCKNVCINGGLSDERTIEFLRIGFLDLSLYI